MKLTTLLVLSISAVLTSCSGQTSEHDKNVVKKDVSIVNGDTVKELGKNIMVVYQDKKNIYWFGSWETGVYRYDGKILINYTTKHGLPNNRIDEIKEDKFGNVYFISCHPHSTVVKFNGQTFAELKAIPSNEWKLQSDDLWFRHSYQTEKVYRFDGITLYELTLSKPTGFTNPYEIYSIYKDSKGNVWFGTNPLGVCRYNGKSFNWITEKDVAEIFNKPNEGANGVRAIVEDKNGNFWFNTEYQYSVYDSITLKSNKFYTRHESIGSLDEKKNSNLNEYLSVLRDNKNDLWFVTYRDGVWKYDGTNVTHLSVQDNSKDITLFSIYKDNNGDLWLGTHENGAYKFNGIIFEKFKP
jgi:ligand-binding sensor domain-containing protein